MTLEQMLENNDNWVFYESLDDMNEAYAFENNVDVSQVTMGRMVSA